MRPPEGVEVRVDVAIGRREIIFHLEPDQVRRARAEFRRDAAVADVGQERGMISIRLQR